MRPVHVPLGSSRTFREVNIIHSFQRVSILASQHEQIFILRSLPAKEARLCVCGESPVNDALLASTCHDQENFNRPSVPARAGVLRKVGHGCCGPHMSVTSSLPARAYAADGGRDRCLFATGASAGVATCLDRDK
jgi:hypothetical protein